MQLQGMIHEPLEIKLLLLYILDRLPAPVDRDTFASLAMEEGGFNWFEFSQHVHELVANGHILCSAGSYYRISDKGRHNLSIVVSTLPFTVRSKYDRLLAPLAAEMQRRGVTDVSLQKREDGTFLVTLTLTDNGGEVMSLRLTAPDLLTAEDMQRHFMDRAESVSGRITALLLEDDLHYGRAVGQINE